VNVIQCHYEASLWIELSTPPLYFIERGYNLPRTSSPYRVRFRGPMPQIIPTAEPFFFPGTGENARIGCLVTHGFTGAPKEMRWLGEYLNLQGYTVCGIRLNGHATKPEDMIRSRWQDWLASEEDGYHLLHSCTDRVFLLGLSMGGILSLTVAARLPVNGVVAMSTPYTLPDDPRIRFTKLISLFMPFMSKGKENPGSDWFDQAAWQQHVSYPENPVRAIAELSSLMAVMRGSLPEVKVPVLLIHSRDDDYVVRDSMERIHAALGSTDKSMLWVEGGGHVITEEPTREVVFKAAGDFIMRVASA
jgi:carboxylesterase